MVIHIDHDTHSFDHIFMVGDHVSVYCVTEAIPRTW